MAQDFKVCRLCLSKTKIYFDLTEDSNSSMLEAITAIKVKPSDSLQTVMCVKCRLNLRLSYIIQQNIIKSFSASENVLHQIAAAATVKEEPEFTLQEEIVVKQEPPERCATKVQVFSCSICHKQFNVKASVYKHCRRTHPGENYDILTAIGESHQVSLKKIRNTDSSGVHSCSVCGRQFQNKNSVYKHMHSHAEIKKPLESENDKACFQCEHCARAYTSESALKCHFNTNHRKRNCPVCNKMFGKSNYYKHLEIHGNKSRRVCHVCGATTSSRETLRSHIRRLHSEKATVLECDVCRRQYRSKQNLENHKKSMHGGERTEVCEICGKKFFSLGSLWSHRSRTHLKTKKFTCEFCTRNFANANSLNNHRRQHTNETPFKCDVCGEGFRQKVSMKAHMRSKHHIEEEKNAVCRVCGKKFATDFALLVHHRIHV